MNQHMILMLLRFDKLLILMIPFSNGNCFRFKIKRKRKMRKLKKENLKYKKFCRKKLNLKRLYRKLKVHPVRMIAMRNYKIRKDP